MRIAAVLVLALVVGCARPHPPLVYVPATTSLGQAVIYCQPHAGNAR